MATVKSDFNQIDEYITAYPPDFQARLQELRKIIRAAAPKAEELISYGMPAYKQQGMLVYFGANKAHIGFYPGGKLSGLDESLQQEISKYKGTPASIHLPYDKAIPKTLVTKIVKYRVSENAANAIIKAEKKAAGKKK
ncbi:hypothetical protein HHL16_01650 [Pseudoflavitalea sp. G-6-1-2]|uniref:iron chaperone n=1 Tax=Pseudoflavitalea sp. G-6-1-2 TaxID=2728841 RepID=UPI00146A7E4D|nr:DUF1801 domain-containing protein [Pseudoflavitalea sp. G-6-1-2]NML19553.1 hypothetical protein [Pseudoflavitalea sp. G-6-1-2]